MPVLLPLLLTLSAQAATAAPSAEIGPGSPAPALSIRTWLKGTPMTELGKDKTYVVEFWATWCGPCIQSIPHVTKLAKENPDVTFLGVGIWEEEKGDNLKQFVAKMGDKMDYNVAYSGNKDGMAASWMDAAGQNGIPAAFIVKNGEIQWVGHPMGMDKPLAEIKAGTFDRAAFKAEFDKEAAMARKAASSRKVLAGLTKSYAAGKTAEAKAGLKQFRADYPEMASSADALDFEWLAAENPKAWETKAVALAKKGGNDRRTLLGFAVKKAGTPAGHAMARKAMGIALKADPKSFDSLLYARYVYKTTGDTKLALDAVETMLGQFATSAYKDQIDLKTDLEAERTTLQAKLAAEKKG